MQIFLYKAGESFNANEFVRSEFDGSTLRTYLNGELTDSRPAKIGDSFFILPCGTKKAPKVNAVELPKTRGAKIAWALSFVGESKYVSEEKDFWDRYQKITQETELMNSVYLLSSGVYALCIADRVADSKKALSKPKIKIKNPILAWISDDITSDQIDELLERFTKERALFCPTEYLKVI